MRNLFIIGMLLVGASMAGWFTIERDGEDTGIKFDSSEIRSDISQLRERGREYLDRRAAERRERERGEYADSEGRFDADGRYDSGQRFDSSTRYESQARYEADRRQPADTRYQNTRDYDAYGDPTYRGRYADDRQPINGSATDNSRRDGRGDYVPRSYDQAERFRSESGYSDRYPAPRPY